MNLNEINFTFGGLHCLRDFGCVYVEKGGHPITGEMQRDEYEISGEPGTLLFPPDLPGTLSFTGTLFFLRDAPRTQQEAQARLRRVSAWLMAGRQKLIFDYEPEVYYLASVDGPLTWEYGAWLDGGLSLSFTAQPYAFSVLETTTSALLQGCGEIFLHLHAGTDTPMDVDILNAGTDALTGMRVRLGAREVAFAGLSLAPGGLIHLQMTPPVGAMLPQGASALPYAKRFDALLASPGANRAEVSLTPDNAQARVTLRARGRWL